MCGEPRGRRQGGAGEEHRGETEEAYGEPRGQRQGGAAVEHRGEAEEACGEPRGRRQSGAGEEHRGEAEEAHRDSGKSKNGNQAPVPSNILYDEIGYQGSLNGHFWVPDLTCRHRTSPRIEALQNFGRSPVGSAMSIPSSKDPNKFESAVQLPSWRSVLACPEATAEICGIAISLPHLPARALMRTLVL